MRIVWQPTSVIEERIHALLPLAAVIDKALVRNPKDRFSDAGKLLATLLQLKS